MCKGSFFATMTPGDALSLVLLLLPQFIIDATDLAKIIKEKNHVVED
jgi:hypothetical protein